jgi:hypothetical protein
MNPAAKEHRIIVELPAPAFGDFGQSPVKIITLDVIDFSEAS